MTDIPDNVIPMDAPADETVVGEQPPIEVQEATLVDPSRELQDRLLRLQADFDNFRKRTRREKEEWSQRCLENICADLLTVVDSFDLGIENSARNSDVSADLLKGFTLVRDQLTSVLGKYGLTPVAANPGTAFDPNVQEAITQIASADIPAGNIVAVTRKGYKLGALLLRPAQVVVSTGEGV